MVDSGTERERRLARTFVRLADSLANGFDVIDLLDDLVRSSVDTLSLSAAGLMLADQNGTLRVMASSSDATHVLELLELNNDEGPCLDCFRSGEAVVVSDEADQARRWPAFTVEARARGFGPTCALPMTLRQQTIGALNLFRAPADPLSDIDLDIGQALADVATIALLQHRGHHAEQQLTVQLQTALNSRVVIEQAKGIIAERAAVDMDAAFAMLRNHARRNNLGLTDLAMQVATGQLTHDLITASPAADQGPDR